MVLSPTLSELVNLNENQIGTVLANMTDRDAQAVMFDWTIWARPDQIPPSGDWVTWLMMAGRGAGKTRAGVEAIRADIEAGLCSRVALVGETAADARDVIVEGSSGILATSPPWFYPKYEPSKRRVTWPNGAMATTYSADDPEQLRGPEHDGFYADELGKWRYAETWDNLMFGLRLGRSKGYATTTPRPVKLIKLLIEDPEVVVTKATTFDNAANLSKTFMNQIIKRYLGTRLGRQEIYAEILDELIGALWSLAILDTNRISHAQIPDLERVVVGVDPAVTANEDSDETGIVVSARGVDEQGYVLDDLSLRAKPADWAKTAVEAYYANRADCIVAEVNNGGDLVEYTIKSIDKNVPVKKVNASRGKIIRAEPVAALYEQGRVKHLGTFAALEDQMANMVQGMKDSPDRVDALVWGLTDVMLLGEDVTELEAW